MLVCCLVLCVVSEQVTGGAMLNHTRHLLVAPAASLTTCAPAVLSCPLCSSSPSSSTHQHTDAAAGDAEAEAGR